MAICVCCGRGLNSFVDYPAVFVSEFSRMPVPNLTLPFFHTDPSFQPPADIADALRKNARVYNKVRRLFREKKAPVKDMERFGDFVENESSVWIKRKYGLSCFNKNEKDIVFSHIEPYVKNLENAVQCFVQPKDLLPKLNRPGSDTLFDMPGSGYNLAVGTRTLYNLGWLESQEVNMYSEELVAKVKNARNAAEIYEIFDEEANRELAFEKEGLPEGYERVSLYIIGLKPDASDMYHLVDQFCSKKLRVKFAEFVCKGKLLWDI